MMGDYSTPQQTRARRMVHNAIRRGDLVRPDACSRCGRTGTTADGRAFVHAHHHLGYDFPLEIEWLCGRCHCAVDDRATGERNGFSRLTEEAVRDIRRRLTPGSNGRVTTNNSGRALAREYGVSEKTIRDAAYGRQWKHVADALEKIG